MSRRFAPLLALAFFACSAHATTIYRCTDAKGNVTMQNDTPCAPGMKQEIRVIGEVPTAPAPAKRSAPAPEPSGPPPGSQFELVRGPVVADDLPASTLAADQRKPPPALFECTTFDSETYLTESGEPESRCVLMNTVGLNGDPNFGAGAACEVKVDTCAALTEPAALCGAWRRRIDEAKFRMTFSAGAEKARRTAEYERQSALFVDSSCR